MIVEVFRELVRRARERYGQRLTMPFETRPVFVVDGFRFFMFKREKNGTVSMWFDDGPVLTGTTVEDFPYPALLEQLDALVAVEQQARTVSETK